MSKPLFRIRPLVWKNHPSGFIARTPVGNYVVSPGTDEWTWGYHGRG